MNFKLWIENTNSLSGIVMGMMANRYDQFDRSVGADWFDDNGEPEIAELIRVSQEAQKTNLGDYRIADRYSKLRQQIIDKLERGDGEGHIIFQGWANNMLIYMPRKVYNPTPIKLQSNGLFRQMKQGPQNNQNWTPLKVDQLPSIVLKGVIVLLVTSMVNSGARPENIGFIEEALESIETELRVADQRNPHNMIRMKNSLNHLTHALQAGGVDKADDPAFKPRLLRARQTISRYQTRLQEMRVRNRLLEKAIRDALTELNKIT